MSWFKPSPQQLSPFVGEVIELLKQPDRWRFAPKQGSFDDFAISGPEGLYVARGSYEGFWYTVSVDDDPIKLTPLDYRALDPEALKVEAYLRQPEIDRAKQLETEAGQRIAERLRTAIAAPPA
jgi:hypothetical protein